jgi:hypothetical protein
MPLNPASDTPSAFSTLYCSRLGYTTL